MDEKFMARCASVAMQGERSRGNAGAVYYDDDTKHIGYLLLDEIRPSQLRENVAELLSDDTFIVLLKTTKEVHVTKLTKVFAMQLHQQTSE